jgi:tRNA uridine 5-carbamoylmethylation protein Kti12
MELILIRGTPGSGKSTLAKSLSKDYIHLETDMFWGEKYEFDVKRLGEAHEWCREQARSYLELIMRYPTVTRGVIVSNTFTTRWELGPYFDMAEDFGIIPQVILCQGNWKNVHDAPQEVIDKMKARFEYDIQSLYANMDFT